MKTKVPELSLAEFASGDGVRQRRFSGELTSALQRFGFVIIRDHAVPIHLLDSAYQLAQQLFALDSQTKLRFRGGLRGYTPFGTEHAKNHRFPDLKEFWQIGRERDSARATAQFPTNVWPTCLPAFQQVFTQLYEALDATGRTLLEALAPALSVGVGYFDERVAQGNSILRLIHYPPIPEDADPHCVRSAAHEDINFLTILVAARGSGLELLDRDGSWLPVETSPQNLIVDSGDMLARLTNDVIPATTHRVVNPQGPNVSRYSMPFFMHPTDETSLACLPACIGAGAKYPEISAGAFLAERLREIGLATPAAGTTTNQS
jgi:isopenicillin N synthase-like dioxygenase